MPCAVYISLYFEVILNSAGETCKCIACSCNCVIHADVRAVLEHINCVLGSTVHCVPCHRDSFAATNYFDIFGGINHIYRKYKSFCFAHADIVIIYYSIIGDVFERICSAIILCTFPVACLCWVETVGFENIKRWSCKSIVFSTCIDTYFRVAIAYIKACKKIIRTIKVYQSC